MNEEEIELADDKGNTYSMSTKSTPFSMNETNKHELEKQLLALNIEYNEAGRKEDRQKVVDKMIALCKGEPYKVDPPQGFIENFNTEATQLNSELSNLARKSYYAHDDKTKAKYYKDMATVAESYGYTMTEEEAQGYAKEQEQQDVTAGIIKTLGGTGEHLFGGNNNQ